MPTNTKVTSATIALGRSACTSFLFLRGSMTLGLVRFQACTYLVIPARCAPITFSLMPPTGVLQHQPSQRSDIHCPSQSHLARYRRSGRHRKSGQQAHESQDHAEASARPVLFHRASGKMQLVYVSEAESSHSHVHRAGPGRRR